MVSRTGGDHRNADLRVCVGALQIVWGVMTESTEERLSRLETILTDMAREVLESNHAIRTQLAQQRITLSDLRQLITHFLETNRPGK